MARTLVTIEAEVLDVRKAIGALRKDARQQRYDAARVTDPHLGGLLEAKAAGLEAAADRLEHSLTDSLVNR